MRGLFAVAWATLGCGTNLPPRTVTPLTPTTVAVVAPVVERASFAVVPAELGDAGVIDRIRHRTRVRRIASARFRLDGDPIRGATSSDGDFVLPVIGESRARIRVVTQDDSARLAVWVDRDDAWDSITTAIELSDGAGRAEIAHGAWIAPGAPVESGDPDGGRRHVHVHDEAVRVEGWVPASSVAKVWLVPAGDRTPMNLEMNEWHSFTPPHDPRPQAAIAIHAVLRAAADPKAPVIAIVEAADLHASLLDTAGASREVEILRPHMRLRGFIAASELTPTEELIIGHGSGTGHGYGMSHTDKIELDVGACLFDAPDGEVVGVQVEHSIRLGRHGAEGRWSSVYVGNAWALATLYVRDTSDDPNTPRWESCTEPSHRR